MKKKHGRYCIPTSNHSGYENRTCKPLAESKSPLATLVARVDLEVVQSLFSHVNSRDSKGLGDIKCDDGLSGQLSTRYRLKH